MSHRRFFSQLLLVSLSTGLILIFLHIFSPFSAYKVLSVASLAFFMTLTTGIYFFAVKAALGSDKNAFTRLVMLFTFVKMLLTAVLVIGYHQLVKPADNFFLIPFFFTYAVFTVFETSFMSKLAKVKPK